MRPVHRGNVPTDDNGIDIEFNDYKKARDPLIHRIGDYCSYCEVALHDQVDVEHVLPKSINGIALMVAGMLEDRDDVEMRTLAVEVAAARGFWSVWMTVFSDNAVMLSLLIERFPGTAKDCFDNQFAFVPRPGGTV